MKQVAPIVSIDYTAQESFWIGGSEVFDGASIPSMPVYLVKGSRVSSIDELNNSRLEKKYFNSFVLKSVLGNVDAVLSLELLDSEGKARKIPQVLLLNRETGELNSAPELTMKAYSYIKEHALEISDDDPRMQRVIDSFFIENSEDVEGGLNHEEGRKKA